MRVGELSKILANCNQNAVVYCGEEGRLSARSLIEVQKMINSPVVVLEYSNNEEAALV